MMFRLTRTLPEPARQAACYASALVLAKGVSFLMTPFFTHYLSPAEYARLDVLQTMADMLSVLIGLGLADTLFRFAGGAENAEERRHAAASILGLAVLSGAAFLAFGQLAAPWIAAALPAPNDGGDTQIAEVRLILASLSFSAIILVPLGWLRLSNRAGRYLIGSGGRAVLQAGLAALALLAGFGVFGVLVGGLIACASLASLAVFWQWRATGVRFDLGVVRRYGGYAAPLVGIGLLAFLTRSFDRWVVADATDTITLAHYALAAKFGLLAAVLVQPFELWWLPRRFAVLKAPDGPEACARRGEFGASLACLAAVMVAAGAPLAITMMTPASYHGAIAYVPALAGLTALHSLTTLLNTGAYSGQNTVRPFLVEGATAGIAVAGAVILVPAWQDSIGGAWGAIAAGALALGFRLLVIVALSQRARPIPYRFGRLLAVATTSGVTLAALSSLSGDGVFPPFLLGGVAMAILSLGAAVMGLFPVPWVQLKRLPAVRAAVANAAP